VICDMWAGEHTTDIDRTPLQVGKKETFSGRSRRDSLACWMLSRMSAYRLARRRRVCCDEKYNWVVLFLPCPFHLKFGCVE
jgi:hypothetical protein